MPVTLIVNGLSTPGLPGETLFAAAGRVGVRVPTSCRTQGKCKECIVEIVEGGDRLLPPTAPEGHLKPPFRLSCQAGVDDGDGVVRCHTMRRGQMRIERSGVSAKVELDPAVTRDADRILIDGEEI